jgi:hypothetical protein
MKVVKEWFNDIDSLNAHFEGYKNKVENIITIKEEGGIIIVWYTKEILW